MRNAPGSTRSFVFTLNPYYGRFKCDKIKILYGVDAYYVINENYLCEREVEG